MVEYTWRLRPVDMPNGLVPPFSDLEEPNKCDKGGHYDKLKTQPILVMKDNMSHDEFMGFLWGNATKYIMRWKNKDGLKDLSKAQVYLKWMIEFMETGDIVVD